jgi:hypothetical protein
VVLGKGVRTSPLQARHNSRVVGADMDKKELDIAGRILKVFLQLAQKLLGVARPRNELLLKHNNVVGTY